MCPELQYTKYRNENINHVKTQLATMNQNVSSKCTKDQDFDSRAWLENYNPFEAKLHHKRNQNQCRIALYSGGKVIL